MFDYIDVLLSLGSVCLLLMLSMALARGMQFLVKKCYASQGHLTLFWELFLGLFLVTSIYAIVVTKGQTMLLLAPVFIFLLIQQILSASIQVKNEASRDAYRFLLASIVVQFSFFLYTLVSTNAQYINFISGDFNIYYRMAIRLNMFGVEAYNFNFDPQYFKTPGVYHYGDLWFYALVAKATHANPSIVFLIAFTCLSSVFSLGLFSYISEVFMTQLNQKRVYLYSLLVAGLFAGFQFCFPAFIRQFAEPYTLSIFNWGKVLVLSCSLIGLFILVCKKHWYATAILSIIAGLFYINSVPAIFGALFMLLFLELMLRRINLKQYLKVNALYVVGLLVPLLLQYKILPMVMGAHNAATAAPTTSAHFLHHLHLGQYLHTALNIFLGGWLQLFTVLPYCIVLLLAYFERQNIRPHWKVFLKQLDSSLLYLLFVFAAGLLSWAALYPLRVDTVQFFHNLVAPIYVIFIALVLFYVILHSQSKILVMFTFVLAMGSVVQSANNIFYANVFNKNEWLSLKQFIAKETKASPFVNIKPLKELSTAFNRKTDQYVPLNILAYQWPEYQNVSLNALHIKLDTADLYYHEAKEDIETSSFALFAARYQHQKINNWDAITELFIKDYGVRYISVSLDTTLPFFIKKHVVDSVLLPNTNYTIYKLAQNGR